MLLLLLIYWLYKLQNYIYYIINDIVMITHKSTHHLITSNANELKVSFQ